MFHLLARAAAAAVPSTETTDSSSVTTGVAKAAVMAVSKAALIYKRDDDDDDDGEPHDYIRWVFVAVVVVVVVAILISFFFYARRRRRMMREFWSGEGASDMEPGARPRMGLFTNPRTHRHACRSGDYSGANRVADDVDPVPTYHAAPGDGDMGFYDRDGNYTPFEPPPYEPPKAALRPE